MYQSTIFNRLLRIFFFLGISFGSQIFAQTYTHTTPGVGTIRGQVQNCPNEIKFEVTNFVRPLTPASSNITPYRSYFWDFGDGHFSFDPNPVHVFDSPNPLGYDVTLRTTRIKSDSDIEDLSIHIGNNNPCNPPLQNAVPNLGNRSLRLDATRSPRLGSFVEYIITYKNICEVSQNGTLIFNYNTDVFIDPNPKFYNGEDIIQNQASLGQVEISFDQFDKQEQRTLFIRLQVRSDISSGLPTQCSVRANFNNTCTINSNTPVSLRQRTVRSHDPNLKEVNQLTICPQESDIFDSCNEKNLAKTLTYTIHFQNIGEGPAKEIIVTDVLHAHLKNNIYQIETSHPNAYTGSNSLTSNANRELTFQFDQINLKGTKQKGYGIDFREADTWGFITYKVAVAKGDLPACASIINQAVIVFDCNAAMTTTPAITHVQNTDCCDCMTTICEPSFQSTSVNIGGVSSETDLSVTLPTFNAVGCFDEDSKTNKVSYHWYPPTGLNNPNIQHPIASPSEETVYTLTTYDSQKNLRGPMAQVTVIPPNPCNLPAISITPTGSIRTPNPSTVQLTSSLNLTGGCLQWYKDGQLIVGATFNDFHPISYGNYWLEYEEEGCITTSNQVRISSNVTPNIPIGSGFKIRKKGGN